MPGIDERLTRELHRLGDAGDSEGGWESEQIFERIAVRKAHRRTARRLEAASLVVAVILATVAGSYGLWKIVGVGRSTRPHPATSVESSINGRIAFVRSHEIDNARSLAAVYAVNQDGSGLAKLSADDEAIADLAWSPDGTRLAFTASQGSTSPEKGETQIYVMNADGSDLTQLTRDPSSQNIAPAWSPDGTRIAFAKWSNDVDPSGLYVIGADGNGETRVTSGPIDTSPAWFPNGSRILFVRSPEGISELHVVNVDGTGDHAVAGPRGGYIGSVALSPDGTRMAFTRLEPDLGEKNFEIFVANADGSGGVRLTRTPLPEGDPTWAPDGSQVAFAREGDIYTMRADGSDVRRLTDSGSDGWPTWQHASEAPSAQPSPLPTPAPVSTAQSVGPLPFPSCFASTATNADLDGDGALDWFAVYLPRPTGGCPHTVPAGATYHMWTAYSEGVTIDHEFQDCRPGCRAIGAARLGNAVFPMVRMGVGTSNSFVEFLHRNPAGGGPWTAIEPADTDIPGFPAGQSARFPFVEHYPGPIGSIDTYYSALGCEGNQVISETATLDSAMTEWRVHRTTLRVGVGDSGVHPRFLRVRVEDSSKAFDPNNPGPGDLLKPVAPCWAG